MVRVKAGYSVVIGSVILAIEYFAWQVSQMQALAGWPLLFTEAQCGPIFCQLGYSQSINPIGIVVDWIVYMIIVYALILVLRRLNS